MATLETTLHSLHRHVVISTRASIHDLFDANRLVEVGLCPEFTFEFWDPSGKLEFSFHLNPDYWNPRTEERLRGRILYCEPRDERGRKWQIKVRFKVQFSENEVSEDEFFERTEIFHSFTEEVETLIDYDATTKKARLHDRRFYGKFMRWLEEADGIPEGLYFNGRRIARVAEPKPPWEQNKYLPYLELKVSVPVFNAFGRQFLYGTIGDVAEFLDRNSDEEICRYPGIGVARLSEMKEELRRLGWKPMK